MREIKFRVWEPLNKKMEILDFALYKFNEGDINTHKFVLPPSHQSMQNPYTMMNLEAVKIMQYTGLKDKNGCEIYEGDITELEVDGDIRRFVVNIKTVIRNVVSHPSFIDDMAKVAITAVVFEWGGFELFPCVDEKGQFDNEKMSVVGNIYDNPELLGDSK